MKGTSSHFVGGWVGPRADLEAVNTEILFLPGLKLQPFGSPARSQTLIDGAIPASK
jgi:hypothetical protein